MYHIFKCEKIKKENLEKGQIQKDCPMMTQLKKLLVLLILDVTVCKLLIL